MWSRQSLQPLLSAAGPRGGSKSTADTLDTGSRKVGFGLAPATPFPTDSLLSLNTCMREPVLYSWPSAGCSHSGSWAHLVALEWRATGTLKKLQGTAESSTWQEQLWGHPSTMHIPCYPTRFIELSMVTLCTISPSGSWAAEPEAQGCALGLAQTTPSSSSQIL